jgi:hypothetical protein
VTFTPRLAGSIIADRLPVPQAHDQYG